MLTIRRQQLAVFSQDEVRNFEGWMLVHLRRFFPAQCAAAGDRGGREMAPHRIGRARVYGINPVAMCKYIEPGYQI